MPNFQRDPVTGKIIKQSKAVTKVSPQAQVSGVAGIPTALIEGARDALALNLAPSPDVAVPTMVLTPFVPQDEGQGGVPWAVQLEELSSIAGHLEKLAKDIERTNPNVGPIQFGTKQRWGEIAKASAERIRSAVVVGEPLRKAS